VPTTTLEAAWVFPVRTYVLEELQARHLTQNYLLSHMGSLAYRQVMDCMKLSPRTIQRLALALPGPSEELWQNLDDQFWHALHSGHYFLSKEEDPE